MTMRRVQSVRAYAFTPATPPTEIQLWDIGANPTDYGVHIWTERSAREVMAAYAARGNPLQIDVEHNAADPPPPGEPPKEPPVTGGYARLELRGGAPWLVFAWSAYAAEQIATRQRLFLSPEYDVDRSTSEIVRLVRVSLVADPGTHHARMLARIAAARAEHEGDASTMNLALFLAALKAACNTDDAEAARTGVLSLIAEVENAANADGGATGATDAPPRTEADAASEYTAGGDADANDDDDATKKKPPVATAADDPMKCGASAIVLATRVAQLEADAKRRDAREAELEAQARVAAAGERIPESLRAFALKLPKADFDTFVNGLPAPVGVKPGGVRAAAKPTRGLSDRRPEGALSEETERHLARAFGTDHRADGPIEELPDGRVRATHLVRRVHAAGGKA